MFAVEVGVAGVTRTRSMRKVFTCPFYDSIDTICGRWSNQPERLAFERCRKGREEEETQNKIKVEVDEICPGLAL